MRFQLFTLFFLAIAHFSVNGQSPDDYCFSKDLERPQTRHFGSITAYEIAHGTNMDKQYLVPDCEPQKVWILHRHGTRLPDKRVIERVERLEQLRDEIVKSQALHNNKRTPVSICPIDFSNIKTWRWNSSITSDHAEYLTSQGYTDLRGTAATYKKLMPGILGKPYDHKQYVFRHTNAQRTTESFKAFTDGLFGPSNDVRPDLIPEKDLLLRPYDYCESWRNHNYEGPNSEYHKYLHSDIWNQTIEAVSKRLGFEYTLESSDVELMYDICRYEQAWRTANTSPWCGAFLPEHIYALEYAQDLHSYYKAGYGYAENSMINCRLVKDMLQHLRSSSQPNAVVYFAHSSGLQTLLTALGVAKDRSPLLASNYRDMINRHWSTSKLDPFGANFMAIKYHCNANVAHKDNVIFFLNQNPLLLDWCNVGLCSLADVLKRYENFANADCNSAYCASGSAMIGASFMTLLLAAIVYLIY